MSVGPITTARVSNLMTGQIPLQSITQTQSQLLQLETELSSGKAVNTPSDNPGAAAVIEQLNQVLQQRQAYSTNLQNAQSSLSQVGSSLTSVTDLLTQAQSIASQNVGSDASAAQRQGAAQVIQSIYSQVLSQANTSIAGVYVFGGENSATAPFVEANGGVEYVGSTTLLQNTIDQNTNQAFQINGASVFGALSGQVAGTADLTPALSGATPLSDLRGANSTGVQPGSIVIGNGTTTATIDLSTASDLNDVAADINAAALAGVTASVTSTGLQLTATGGANITVTEAATNTTAADLGILTPVGGGANVPVNGAALEPNVTAETQLSALRNGAGIDSAGFILTSGANSKTISVTSPPLPANPTVQDLLNEINGSGLGVRAQINSAGTGIDLLNQTQGASVSIGENGGTTATDLGIRSFTPSTELSQLNDGNGVTPAASGPDFSITDTNGVSFDVSISGDTTVQNVIDSINTAATTAGAGVTASFATTGNGIVLTDTAGGGGTLAVQPMNASSAAQELGLTTAASGNTIAGADVNPVNADGIFTHLLALASALENNDTTGITTAAEGLATDQNTVIAANGAVGAQVQGIQSRQTQLTAENTATQSMLSSLQDVDYTQAITQYQTLQTSLQAAMESASTVLNLSLLDFLQ